MLSFNELNKKLFFMIGPNVIESEKHCLHMAQEIKKIMNKLNINFIFKASFDKANRTSLSSYRGVGITEGLRILQKVKDTLSIPIITDIHEGWQAPLIAKVADIIQVPAFLCRQTDLLKAVAETGKIISIKKGQFCSAHVMHKCADKIRAFGNNQIILCERGNMYGYQDLIVDPRNLIWLKGDNLVSMDITHCLQQPAQIHPDGSVKAGGLRELIPAMGKLAIALGVNGIFMETHDRPDESLCDAPTQFPLVQLEDFITELIKLNNHCNIRNNELIKKVCFIPARYGSTRLPGKPLLKINGKTIINLVWDQVNKCKLVNDIIVLTDDIRIKNEVTRFGGNCEIVDEVCLNGTERIVKYIQKNSNICDLIINVQGDEPFINPVYIDTCIQNYLDKVKLDKNIKCSTLHHILENKEDVLKRTKGKIVLDKNNNILFCSRNIIPGKKDMIFNNNNTYYGHIGIFVFDKEYLINDYIKENTSNQLSEDIEWLKILEQGYKINSVLVNNPEISVDIENDYLYLINKYKHNII
jgi:2-dehydro-3-deoxyphosphooctonate aldolase (KDO 8-P synthase)